MNVKLKPFMTPNFVIPETSPVLRQDGWAGAASIPIGQVDAEELSQMCDAFRAEVFKKANKQDPRRQA